MMVKSAQILLVELILPIFALENLLYTMMRHILTFLIYMLSVVTMSAGEPFCDIRNYDERDGLSQRLVKQVVQDDNGVLWVATWNGLNCYDGL